MTATFIGPLTALFLVAGSAWTMPSVQRPTLPFGVRVPVQRAGDDAIAEQVRAFRTRVAGAGLLALIATITLGTVFSTAEEETLALIGSAPTVALLLLVALFYLRARRAILRVKTTDDWYGGLAQRVAVDTSLRTRSERFPWAWTLPALLTLLGTLAVGIVLYPDMPARIPMRTTGLEVHAWQPKSPWVVGLPVTIGLFTTALVIGLLAWSYRSRADLEPSAPVRSAAQHRLFLQRIGRALLLFTAGMNAAMLFAFVPIWQGRTPGVAAMTGLMLVCLLSTAYLIIVGVRTGQGGSRILADEQGTERPDAAHFDDDRYWRFVGLCYVNREDPAILVQKRVGLGWTFNFGNPRSYLVLAGILVITALIVLVPVLA
ncbi:DUF1648 domain-containing protein [Plantactinospora sonchi]|uniref:DUF5808 domain-containing protein n=1 Tax=Plantactinospora sonchi TaxID=1544735 RepID=A0ABU7RLI3_9ACTN